MSSFEAPQPLSLKQELDPELGKRDQRSDKALSLLGKLHADQTFDTPEHKQEFLDRLSYEEIKKIGLLTNDVLRGKSKSEDFDGGNVLVQGNMMGGSSWVEYLPPREEDKEKLLSTILSESKKLSPEDAAVVLGVGINAVHPFADGNGRTSRLLYTLLSEGYDGSETSKEKIQQILGENGREYVDLNPDRIMHIAAYYLERKAGIDHQDPHSVTESWSDAGAQTGDLAPETLPVKEEIDRESREQLIRIIENRKLRTITFYAFLKEQDMLTEPFIKYRESENRYRDFKRPDKWTTVKIDEVLRVLSQEQVNELIEISGKVRGEAVMMMTAFLSRPEKFKVNQDATVKDYFLAQVEQYRRKE